MTDLLDVLEEYEPDWRDRFNTLREACEHFGLEACLEDAETEEEYEELNFNE